MWSPLVIAYVAQRFNERFGQGSASYVEVRDRFIGAELKRSYYEQACRNLAAVDGTKPDRQPDLFAGLEQTDATNS